MSESIIEAAPVVTVLIGGPYPWSCVIIVLRGDVSIRLTRSDDSAKNIVLVAVRVAQSIPTGGYLVLRVVRVRLVGVRRLPLEPVGYGQAGESVIDLPGLPPVLIDNVHMVRLVIIGVVHVAKLLRVDYPGSASENVVLVACDVPHGVGLSQHGACGEIVSVEIGNLSADDYLGLVC